MAREPTYPEEAPVGDEAASTAPATGGEEGKEAKPEPNRTKHLVTGAAIGIGSAALVAALLYANRSRKNDRNSSS